jgi:hypothetical protein
MIYPSPARSDRYILVVASTSTTGFYFWNPAAFWHQGLGFPTLFWDWTVRDGRRSRRDTLHQTLGRTVAPESAFTMARKMQADRARWSKIGENSQ